MKGNATTEADSYVRLKTSHLPRLGLCDFRVSLPHAGLNNDAMYNKVSQIQIDNIPDLSSITDTTPVSVVAVQKSGDHYEKVKMGLDTTPSEGSTNLLTSGAVANAFTDAGISVTDASISVGSPEKPLSILGSEVYINGVHPYNDDNTTAVIESTGLLENAVVSDPAMTPKDGEYTINGLFFTDTNRVVFPAINYTIGQIGVFFTGAPGQNARLVVFGVKDKTLDKNVRFRLNNLYFKGISESVPSSQFPSRLVSGQEVKFTFETFSVSADEQLVMFYVKDSAAQVFADKQMHDIKRSDVASDPLNVIINIKSALTDIGASGMRFWRNNRQLSTNDPGVENYVNPFKFYQGKHKDNTNIHLTIEEKEWIENVKDNLEQTIEEKVAEQIADPSTTESIKEAVEEEVLGTVDTKISTLATKDSLDTAVQNVIKSNNSSIVNIITITQSDYDALETKDSKTLYIITEA